VTDELARLAARVERDPFFLGWALRIYAESEGLDETGAPNLSFVWQPEPTCQQPPGDSVQQGLALTELFRLQPICPQTARRLPALPTL